MDDLSDFEPNNRLKKLASLANDFTIDRRIPVRRYYRSGQEMVKMANTYYLEENFEKSYVLYLKYMTLFLEKLHQHPEFKVPGAVTVAERKRMKLTLKDVMPKTERLKLALKLRFEQEYELKYNENQIKKEEENKRREIEMRQRTEEKGKMLRENLAKYQEEKELAIAIGLSKQQQHFEDIRRQEEEMFNNRSSQKDVGHQEIGSDVSETVPSAPPAPEVDRSTKPDVSRPSTALHSTEEGSGLRRVSVPSCILGKFLNVARPNTLQTIETCGILAGRLGNNAFSVTHLLIPKQIGTPDSCTTQSEEELFEIQDRHDLITLGWIHTHPTQTAFLSSVDLHTQLSYQLMLPEALAIVCSPKFDETGFFTLTPNYGLDYLANCREQGFHPHPNEPPLFEEGNHVDIDYNGNVELIDLR